MTAHTNMNRTRQVWGILDLYYLVPVIMLSTLLIVLCSPLRTQF